MFAPFLPRTAGLAQSLVEEDAPDAEGFRCGPAAAAGGCCCCCCCFQPRPSPPPCITFEPSITTHPANQAIYRLLPCPGC